MICSLRICIRFLIDGRKRERFHMKLIDWVIEHCIAHNIHLQSLVDQVKLGSAKQTANSQLFSLSCRMIDSRYSVCLRTFCKARANEWYWNGRWNVFQTFVGSWLIFRIRIHNCAINKSTAIFERPSPRRWWSIQSANELALGLATHTINCRRSNSNGSATVHHLQSILQFSTSNL